MNRWSRTEIAAVGLVLVASLVLRLVSLDALIVSDEMRWTCRSLGFQEAVLQGDWTSTFRVGHPGVVTTWLGALSIPRTTGALTSEALDTCRDTDDAKRLNEAGQTSKEVSQRLSVVGDLLFAGRVGIAVLTWLCLVAIYFLVRLLWGVEMGVAGLVLVAFSPFYLAHCRFLHVDGVLASLMTLSLLCLLAAVRHWRSPRWRTAFLLLSGAAGGLAAVQKSPALFLAPFAALVLMIDLIRRGVTRQRLLLAVRDWAIWGIAAGVVYVAAWPAMWVDPIGTVSGVLEKAIGYAEEGHTPGNYFMGRPVLDPGWAFYPAAVLFRLSPLSFLGIVVSVGWLVTGDKQAEERFGLVIMLLYSTLFGVFMSLGAKKFDRYILPVFPVLGIVAAFGLVWLASIVREHIEGDSGLWIAAGSYVLAVTLELALILPHRPHYLTYYNPLLGGAQRAEDVLLLGWGEGYEEIVPYLNAKPDAEELQVAVSRFSGFAPVFRGEPRSMRTYSAWETDYVVIYVGQVQRQRYEWLLEDYFYSPEAEPEHIVSLQGVDYAWIYPNRHYVLPMEYLEEQGRRDSEQCLLMNGNSLFAKHYKGELPTYAFYGQWNPAEEAHFYWSTERLAELVDGMGRECGEVWYARYPEYETDAYVRLLESRGLLVEQASYPHMELLLYRLIEPKVDETSELRFGDLRLTGYGLSDPSPAWGRDGGVFMAWEAREPLEEDYSVFIHLHNTHGQRIAQGDSLLVDEALQPTSQWVPGDSNVALYHLPIPPGTPPGLYDLALGVYQLDTGNRLPILNGEEGFQDKSAQLQVEIGTPDRVPQVAELGISHPLEREVASGLGLLGYDLEREAILAGHPLALRLTWKALGAIEPDYRLELGLRGGDGMVHMSSDVPLVATDYPSSRWQPGEVLQEWYHLPVADTVPTGEMTLTVNLVDENGRRVLRRPIGVTERWVQSRKPCFEMPAHLGSSQAVTLGDKVTLLGYDVASSVRAGENLSLTVYWHVQQEVEESYKVFVHLYDEEGNIVAQQDRVPGLGARPTTTWEKGEIVGDRVLVPIDSAAPVGELQLAIGLYDAETGARLTAYGPDGQRLEKDRVLLGLVEVAP